MGGCRFCLQCFTLGAVAALVLCTYAALFYVELFKKGKKKGGKNGNGH